MEKPNIKKIAQRGENTKRRNIGCCDGLAIPEDMPRLPRKLPANERQTQEMEDDVKHVTLRQKEMRSTAANVQHVLNYVKLIRSHTWLFDEISHLQLRPSGATN
jgi:hypothetical protein